ncbi:MAG: double zinc ribbon domain-containing protein [Gammaproteobacteria bacterium]
MIPDEPDSGKPGALANRVATRLGARLQAAGNRLATTCLGCGARGAGSLCPACFRDLPWNDHPCTHCAAPLPELPGTLCGACARRPPFFDAAAAAFVYAWPVNRLLQNFKFHGSLATGRVLALALGEYLELREETHPDVLIPVPLHRERLAERGFNQASELVRTLARSLGVPAAADILRRTRATPPQLGLDRQARRRNLRGAFACTSPVSGLRIAVVDDVMTTGSTAEAIARVLKQAGAIEVRVYAVARA